MPKAQEHIDDFIEEKARTDSGYAIAYAILQLADKQRRIANWHDSDCNRLDQVAVYLGDKIASGLSELAAAISDHKQA